MKINEDIKSYHRYFINQLKTKQEIKDYIQFLYCSEEFDYQNIKTIFDFNNVEKVIKILEERDIKRCAQCNIIKSRSQCFHNSKSRKDGKQSKCTLCGYLQHPATTEDKKMSCINFHQLNDITDKNNFIIDLYKSYTIQEISGITQMPFDEVNNLLIRLNIRKCSNGENCLNPNGPVQPRENFTYCSVHKDQKSGKCKTCQKAYRKTDREIQLKRTREHYRNNRERYREYHRRRYLVEKNQIDKRNASYDSQYAKFDTHNNQISYAEKTRQDPNNLKLLQVKCVYCNSWFNPTNRQVRSRTHALEGRYSLGVENRFYCSDECKNSCPIYKQKEYSKDDPRYFNNLGTSREVQSELRQSVFERDNWTCQRCSTYKDNLPVNISLHCHHIEGIRHEPLESADMDTCMTVCSECHKQIHQIPGCTYQDFQCKIEESKIRGFYGSIKI